MDPLFAISPIDGRYAKRTQALQSCFSEFALIKHRLIVMTEWVIQLSSFLGGHPRVLTDVEKVCIRSFADITETKAQLIKDIEVKGAELPIIGKVARTNHDVKACEVYLRSKFTQCQLKEFVELIHFGGTSEDVNNIAYALMLRQGVHGVLIPKLEEIHTKLVSTARLHACLPMLSRTHGQAASPTTLGKECNVFAKRLERQLNKLREQVVLIKLNGASGNYCAFVAAYPDVDWVQFTHAMWDRMNEITGDRYAFEANLVTTQIEPHDTYAELFALIMRIGNILIDLATDEWRYISDDWLGQKPDGVGSSAMPHKVNPIDFENAEGNLEVADALFAVLSRKLPRSRLQRDLSDSTVERNFGYAFGLTLVAYTSLLTGLNKVTANPEVIARALEHHPEVLAEAYQTVLRRINYPDPYGALKKFTQGHKITMDDMRAFIGSLDVPDDVKEELRAFTPENYIGRAPYLARL